MKLSYAIPLVLLASCSRSQPDTRERSEHTRGWAADLHEATTTNSTFRTVLFTGAALQLTVMNVAPGQEIGLEMHPKTDQLLRVEAGSGRVVMGAAKNKLDDVHEMKDGSAVIVPAGTWHTMINTGSQPLKLYAIYAPPQHPAGTVHATKADADAAEE